MSDPDQLGSFEETVFYAVLLLRENAYGMTIRREIHARTGRDVAIGAVYTTLDRLEKKGWVSSSEAAGGPERGGRPKRMFHPTTRGIAVLENTRTARASMTEGLDGRPGLAMGV